MRKAPLFPVLTILLAVVILAVYYLTSRLPKASPPAEDAQSGQMATTLDRPRVLFGNPTVGPKGAKATVVVFGDYLCQPCADIDVTLRQLTTVFPNDVLLVWKDFPNESLHPGSTKAAVAARCAADQGAFWEYHSLLMDGQAGVDETGYIQAASALGLDTAQFSGCLRNQQTLPLIQRDLEEGLQLRLDGTPYLFVNERPISGSVGLSLLQNIVQEQIDAASRNGAGAPAENEPTGGGASGAAGATNSATPLP